MGGHSSKQQFDQRHQQLEAQDCNAGYDNGDANAKINANGRNSDSSSSLSVNYRYEHGRRFHNVEGVHYLWPNDDVETDRLHFAHYLMRHTWDSNFSSPVTAKLLEGIRVLDMGCGPGTWVQELATEYPKSKIVGVDISPIYPSQIKPNNAQFVHANILDGLPFPDDYFDFVHMRFLLMAFTAHQWNEKVIAELLRVTKPGGWIELMESDARWHNEGPCSSYLMNALRAVLQSKGIAGTITSRLPDLLQSTELVDNIKSEHHTIPFGSWGKRTGELGMQAAAEELNSSAVAISQFLQVSPDEYQTLVDGAVAEFDMHKTSMTTCRCYGQKMPSP